MSDQQEEQVIQSERELVQMDFKDDNNSESDNKRKSRPIVQAKENNNDQGVLGLEQQDSLSAQLNDIQHNKVKRRMSKLERETLSRAVQEVRKVAERYTDEGLSTWNFWLGQTNVAIVFYVLGHNPDSYWIVVMLKCYIYLGLSWKSKIETKTDLWYMIEFCWVTCHIYMLWLTIAFIQGCGVEADWMENLTYNKYCFFGFWGLANGPFAFSSILFKNALVLHDIPNLASTFIHLTPCTLAWTARWWALEMMETWNVDGRRIFLLPDPTDDLQESFWAIFVPSFLFYLCWWALYWIYIVSYGRHIGAPWHKYDTLYHWTMQSDKKMAKLFRYDCSTEAKRKELLPIAKYMTFNVCFMTGTIAFSYLMYLNFWVHTAFIGYLFASVTYYGALRYYNMMTKYYMKKVEKLVDNRIARSGLSMEVEEIEVEKLDVEKLDVEEEAEKIDVEEDYDTKKVVPEIVPDDE